MAVGKGSMQRAARAMDKKTETQEKNPVKKSEIQPDQKVMEKIVYQKNSGILERDALPNERFGLGEAMPVYYF